MPAATICSGFVLVNFLVPVDDSFAGLGMDDFSSCQTADDSLGQRRQQALFGRFGYPDAVHGAAIIFAGNDILGDINQTPGQVAGTGCSQGGIGQTFAGAVGGDEVLQNAQAFAQAGLNREVDNSTGRVGHQTSHTGHLLNLGNVTFGAGGGHHINAAGSGPCSESGHRSAGRRFPSRPQRRRYNVHLRSIKPLWNWFSMIQGFGFSFFDQFRFGGRDFNIAGGNGDAGGGGIMEAQMFLILSSTSAVPSLAKDFVAIGHDLLSGRTYQRPC